MKRTVEIIPAILPKDFAEIEEKIALVKGSVETVQIDICDGQFVTNTTWPYKRKDETFEQIVHEESGMPGWQNLDFEADLMINKPESVVGDWVRAGAVRIIIHAESRGSVSEAINLLAEQVEIGLALNMETSLDAVKIFENHIKFIQCMGIDQIGFQAQQFDEKVIEKVRQAKQQYPKLAVSVDGGVSLLNAPRLIEAGVDRLVAGSAIFGADNPLEAIRKFKQLRSAPIG
ncbi:MAG: ribulose-phosphate 3-epimerase [Candidatus Parcubacteria bacterium]|jgi:ribulose-phosphate 3-epimerase|nr:ribulose-phosphate 3-epimerase [Candidatus Parcubacteria bacterium]